MDPLPTLAFHLSAMVDLGRVDAHTAVVLLAEQASWNARRLRQLMIDLQQDPDVTPPTLALLHQAAAHAAGRVAVRPPGPAGSGPSADPIKPDRH